MKRKKIERIIAGKTKSEILLMNKGARCYWYKKILPEEKREAMRIVSVAGYIKISESNRDRQCAEETKSKIRASWTPKKRAEKSVSMMGKNNPNFGKPRTEEVRNKISIGNMGKIRTEEHRAGYSVANMGEKNPNFGNITSEATKIKISVSNTGKIRTKEHRVKYSAAKTGENNPNYIDGRSFEPYGPKFNNKLKEQIRKRDNYTCQECDITQDRLGQKLDVHHKDYDKTNNDPDNLISLCPVCHGKTGFNREDWTEYFRRKINGAD